MRIAPHFSISELSRTATGLENQPGEKEIANLQRLALDVLEPIRDLLACKLIIHSAFRSPAVNKTVGGAWNSAHLDGRAADFHPDCKEHIRLCFDKILKSGIYYDKILLEYKSGQYWIHVQIPPDGHIPRRLAEFAVIDDHGTHYKEVPR